MATNVVSAANSVFGSNQVNNVDNRLQNARTILLQILVCKKHMMDADERMKFLKLDEELYSLIHNLPLRDPKATPILTARALLKSYGKSGVL